MAVGEVNYGMARLDLNLAWHLSSNKTPGKSNNDNFKINLK